MKEYRTASNYEMVVSKDNVRRFMDEVGFLNERKNAQLQDVAGQYKKGFYKERFLATFERLDPMGEEPVYDLTEPMTHSFVANGLCVSNCGEEFLENYGNCCLGSINLDVHVRDGSIDWDSLEETVRTSVRFLDDVINVNSFPLDKLREVNLATRRIGLGVMGWADALVRMNVPYDSPDALEAANEVGGFIKRIAWDESANLARERGPFPEYEGSALKERGLPPVRNSSVITIAPTGTISRIAGCSSGIEPHFALAWWSNVLWKDHEGSSSRLLDAPASTMESLKRELGDDKRVREVLEQIIENPEGAESTLKEYGLNPAVYRTAMSISPESHVRMQGAWQDHVTNSVSKTINLPNSATVDDVRRAYELAWETGMQGGDRLSRRVKVDAGARNDLGGVGGRRGHRRAAAPAYAQRAANVGRGRDRSRTHRTRQHVRQHHIRRRRQAVRGVHHAGQGGRLRFGEPGGGLPPGVAGAAVRDRPGRDHSPPSGDHLLPRLGRRYADTLGPGRHGARALQPSARLPHGHSGPVRGAVDRRAAESVPVQGSLERARKRLDGKRPAPLALGHQVPEVLRQSDPAGGMSELPGLRLQQVRVGGAVADYRF